MNQHYKLIIRGVTEMTRTSNLQCEAMRNPLGIDIRHPRLTWIIEANQRNVKQTAYRLIVTKDINNIDEGKGDFYDSGRIESDDSFCVIEREVSESGVRYFWSVKIWDQVGDESEWSLPAWWEMGLLNSSDWQAKWIEPNQRPAEKVISNLNMGIMDSTIDESRMVPCQLIRREFIIEKGIKRARVYATAHGVYELELNGKRIGDLKLAPECTPYDKYLQFQTYDITEDLRLGVNVIGAHLAPGWWSGIIGLFSASCQYGDKMAVLLQIEINYEDGTRQIIASDNTFKSSESPVRYAEIFVGEKYDANHIKNGWSMPGFIDQDWEHVQYTNYEINTLRGQNAPHIRVKRTIKAKQIIHTPKGETIVDFGQVIAGYPSIVLHGTEGQKVILKYTEELGTDGNFCLNVFGADKNQTDTYIFNCSNEILYEPKFVYHGFRYVMIEGYSAELVLDELEAKVIYSDLDITCQFECSDARVTKLHENLVWTTVANMMSIPTDNPDRERAGWTGDAQMYLKTACYHVDLNAFCFRWLNEMRLEQLSDGRVPLIVPNWKSYNQLTQDGAAGWGDACVIIPWIMYSRYGDKRVLEENYQMMVRWVEYVRNTAEYKNPASIGEIGTERAEHFKFIWNTGYKFGDWLTPSECITENGQFTYQPTFRPLADFLPCCYYVYTTKLMSEIADELGKTSDAAYYLELSKKAKEACIAEVLTEDGTPEDNTQGAKVLALAFGFVPDTMKQKVVNDLVNLINENNGRMDTGFTSTQCLLDVLLENGRRIEAYDRLFSNQMPSWLYEVEKGATGIWESWQAIMPDGTVNPVSFIQYAAGSVGNWMYRNILGICEAEPGYKKICFKPEFDDRLIYARGVYDSAQGRISSDWNIEDGIMVYKVTVPPNASAYVYLPKAKTEMVLEGGKTLERNPDIHLFKQIDDKTLVEIGSGEYMFVYNVE